MPQLNYINRGEVRIFDLNQLVYATQLCQKANVLLWYTSTYAIRYVSMTVPMRKPREIGYLADSDAL